MLLVAPPPAAAHPVVPAVGSDVVFPDAGDYTPDGLVRFSCQRTGAAVPCFGPDQIRTAYDVQPLLHSGITGAGSTIVVIDGFQSPTLQSDLATFDSVWGLPAPNLQVVAPDGLTPFDGHNPMQISWAIEISIDVELSHMIAPGASIVLVLAKSGDDTDLLSATRYAIANNLGDVISQSFSEAESCPSAAFLAGQHSAFREAADNGMTLVASTGDHGAAEHACDGTLVRGVATPASDPLVTAVGGTRLSADLSSGAYQSETGWGDQFGASGGGFSAVYRRPGYQAPFIDDNSARGLPDVSLSGSASGSVIARALGGFGRAFGTSAATAEWAGIVALADQSAGHRLGALDTALYHAAKFHDSGAFHDITTGNSSVPGFTGFSAGPGWDPVTGLGTPDVARLVAFLSVRD